MRSRDWMAWLGLSAVLLASGLLPLPGGDGRIAHVPDFCPFYNLTGLPCPGCGLTRAFVCLGHGSLWEAFHWNPLGPALYLLFVLLWLRAGLTLIRKRPLLPLSPATIALLSQFGLLIIVTFGLARIAWLLATHHPWPGSSSR